MLKVVLPPGSMTADDVKILNEKGEDITESLAVLRMEIVIKPCEAHRVILECACTINQDDKGE